jgi:hypothetical protein
MPAEDDFRAEAERLGDRAAKTTSPAEKTMLESMRRFYESLAAGESRLPDAGEVGKTTKPQDDNSSA